MFVDTKCLVYLYRKKYYSIYTRN